MQFKVLMLKIVIFKRVFFVDIIKKNSQIICCLKVPNLKFDAKQNFYRIFIS